MSVRSPSVGTEPRSPTLTAIDDTTTATTRPSGPIRVTPSTRMSAIVPMPTAIEGHRNDPTFANVSTVCITLLAPVLS